MERRKDDKGRVLKEGESQRKNGTYMFRYYDLSKKRKCIYAKTLSELREKEKEVNKDGVLGIYTNDFTLNDAFDRYISTKTDKELKPRTKYKYIAEYDRWIRNTWIGNKKLKELNQSDIKFFYKEKSEKDHFADGTIRILHKYINGALEVAYNDDFIRRNYAKGCNKLYSKVEAREPLSIAQTDAFLTECENTKAGKKYMLGFKLLLLSGLRVGEMTGLTWDDIDLKNRIINVNHQFVTGDDSSRTAYHIDTPKSGNGIRKVPMSNDLYQLFTELKRETYFEAYKFGSNVDGYTGFVMHTRTGLPILYSHFNAYAKDIVSHYNETHEEPLPNVSCHICRHTFCTRMAELKINPTALKKIMGHSDYKTTDEVYIDVSDDFVKEEFFLALRGKEVI